MDSIQNTLMKPEVKILKLISTLFLWGLILTGLNGCDSDCEYDIETGDDGIAFAIIDKNSGEYLFQESNLTYHIDTFKIFDQNHVQLGEYDYGYFRDGSYGYRFSIFNIYDDTIDPDPLKQEVCKQYYLYLNYTDTDTLETCFTAKSNGCVYFDKFKVFYNGSLVFTQASEPQLVSITCEILK